MTAASSPAGVLVDRRVVPQNLTETMMWENLDKTRPDSAHYSVMRLAEPKTGMEALRGMFPDAKANELNFVLFSTSGVHGTYNTIEEAEAHLQSPGDDGFAEVTFLVLRPRLVALRYGNCHPETPADIAYLKRLRTTSHAALAKVGIGAA